jgi:hypothetical protein
MATYEFTGPNADSLSASHMLELMENLTDAMRDLARRPVTLAKCDTEVTPGHDYLHFYSNGRGRFGIAAGVPTRRDFWPDNVSPVSLDGLLKLPGELTVSHVFRLATPGAAKRFIDSVRKYHEGRRLDARAVLTAALKGVFAF